MSDLVKEMLGKFIALSQEEKAITAENDAAIKEYNDYCAGSEKDLNEKIEEIHKKMDKLNYYMDYAREHADPRELEDATAPFDTPDGTLESIRQTIKLESTDDPNAETLYIKATGKKLFYEQEIARVSQLIEGSKVQAKRQFDSETAKLNRRKEEHFDKVRSYVQSSDFAEYLKLLVYDKSAFNSPGTVNLSDDSCISLGQRRVKLSVPMDIEQEVSMNSNGEYNAAARTIGAPYQVSAKKGGTLFLEHDERNGQYLLGGVQRLLLNFIKYFGNNLMRVIFCDPDRFSVDTLGNISALGKGINPFITVPKSMEEIEGKVARLAAKSEAAPTPGIVSRILVLQSFPEKYSPDFIAKILDICTNAEKTGVLVVISHFVSSDSTPAEMKIRELSEVIRSRNGGFWIERERESLFWYSAPSDISDEVRRVYVEKRNQDALKAAQEPEPAPVEAPKAETKPEPVPAEAPKAEIKPEPVPAEAPKAEIKPEPAPVEAPKAETKPEPAPIEAPKAETKPEPVPAEAPKAEIKPEPAPVEAPKAETKPEPAPAEAPKAEIKPEPVPAEAPKAEIKPEPAPVEAPKAETKPEPAPVEAPKAETKPEPAPVEAPKAETKPEPAPVEAPKAETKPEPAPVEAPKAKTKPEPAPVEAPKAKTKPEPAPGKETSRGDQAIPAHILFSNPQPKKENKEVTMTVLSEISDQLPPPAPDPFEALADVRPRQELDPELTYRITDKPSPASQISAGSQVEMTYKITDHPDRVASMNAAKPEPQEYVEKNNPIKNVIDAGKRKIESLVDSRRNTDYPIRSLLDDEPAEKPAEDISMVSMDFEDSAAEAQFAHQTAARETAEVTPDMTYKITDFPEKVASMNAPKPEYVDPEEKPGAIKTMIGAGKSVIDAGKRKIESLVDSRKNNDYPIRSLLDDEKVETPADEISMDPDAAEEKSLLTHQTAARETAEVTPDMTYKITDFPEKVASMNAPKPEYVDPEEKPGAIKTMIGAGKSVIDAGKRKIESLVDSRKNNDYPIRSLLDDEKVETPADEISMDPDAAEEKSLLTHQTAARETAEVTPDMTYKITDFPEKVASMNAPKPEYVDPEEKPGAIKTVIGAGKSVIDAGKRKIESLVDSRKNNDYPIRSLLDDEKVETPADEISMDPEAAEEKSLLTHQTAARETAEVTPDMTYKITDFPDKVASMNAPKPEYVDPEEKPGAIKTMIGAGKSVIDAGKRKIESLVDSRKNNDYPIRSLLDDEKVETPADEISMDPEAAEEKSLLTHQTAARETAEVTPDMTYKITDFPDKVASMNAPKPGQQPAAKTPTVNENQDMTYRITDKLPAAAKQPAAPTATIELEPEPIEDVFGKGVRKLPQIPIGKSVNGRFANLNISGNLTYVCGNRGDDRKTLTDRIITQIIASTHPDDVELWLFDCGDGEFMKYADDSAAHIKYLVFDTGADTSTDFAEVIAAELDRRVEAFTENGWSDVKDIPADVFMPRIMVAVNAFPKFAENIVGTTKYFGRNHSDKLSRLFKSCGGYGIHFLLIGDEFSDSGERPHCLEGITINSAVAVTGRDRGISNLFGDIKLYDNEVESLRKIPSGCAFVAEADSSNGLTLVRLGGENAVNEHTYSEASEYSDKLEEYLGKNPFIGDRKAASKFEDRGDYRAEQIKNRDEGECLLFLGEPCRFMGEYPVRLFDDFGENLLTIAPAREKSSAALMVRAALRSLDEQGIAVEILACRSNPVYSELHRSGELDNLEVFEGGKAEARIKELADMLDKGKRPDVFEIVLGGDLLMASMSAGDMLPVLKRALVKGPRDGAHFMFISGSVAQTESEFLSLFRHKLVFACPYNEAEKLLRDPNCDLPENGFRLSNDYDELTILPYSM